MIHPTNPPADPNRNRDQQTTSREEGATTPEDPGATRAGQTTTRGPKVTPREERAIAFLRQIESLPDGELLIRLRGMVVRERRSTTQLLAHLAVLDSRRHFLLARGYSSLFNYCTRGLHFSEQAAYLRIEAARVIRRFPAVLARVADGSVHLTALSLLKPHLTAENHRHLLDAACHRTRREIEDLVAPWRIGPAEPPRARFDVLAIPPRHGDPDSDFPLPFQGGPVGPGPRRGFPGHHAGAAGGGHIEFEDWRESGNAPEEPMAGATDERETRSSSEGIDSTRRTAWPSRAGETVYRLHISISAETRRKLDRASELLRHQIPDGDPARIIDRALGVLLDRLEQRKFARVLARPEAQTGVRPADLAVPEGAPPTDPEDTVPAENRSDADRPPIPAAVRRAVWRRDRGRCTFVGTEGERCDQVGLLEYHHRRPWAQGGLDTVDNLELRCRPHNEFESEITYLRTGGGKKAFEMEGVAPPEVDEGYLPEPGDDGGPTRPGPSCEDRDDVPDASDTDGPGDSTDAGEATT